MKLVFMGSCPFSLNVLSILGGHTPFQAIFTAPAKPKGRGHKIQKTCVQDYAQARGWPIYTPVSLKETEPQEVLRALSPDLIIVASYGLILPRTILDIPAKGCINVHPSLLPRWRGASPLVYPILEAESQTGVSLMLMDEGMDTGPLLWQESMALSETMTSQELSHSLSRRGAEALLTLLPAYLRGEVESIAQSDQGVTYAPKIKKEEGALLWHEDAKFLEHKIRALNPWPGTWGNVKEKKIFILSAQIAEMAQGETYGVGDILPWGKGFALVCGGRSLLIPTQVKPEGGKAMDSASFMRGYGVSLL